MKEAMSENESDFIPVTELGRKGLTWDWSKMELNKKYFLSRANVSHMMYLLELNQIKLITQAEKLNAALIELESSNHDGWFFTLIPKESLSSKPLNA